MEKNSNFFAKIKNAIFNFDEYKNFAVEKLSRTIVYLILLMLMFSIIITVSLTIKTIEKVEEAKQYIKEQFPEFRFENNTLIIDQEKKHFIIGDDELNFGIIVDSEKESLEEIEEASDFQSIFAVLKNKVIAKNINGLENVLTYETINESFDINNLNKETVLEFLSSNTMIAGYIVFVIISIFTLFVIFLIQTTIDIFMLSLLAFLISRLIGIKLKYKPIFSISVYGLTLSVILYIIYMVVNLFTGFNIVYFDIAYRAISYVYIVTVLLIIKNDLIKQNMELKKIIEVQKQVRKEIEQEKQKEEDKKKEKKEKQEKQKDKKEDEEKGQEPEGNQA